MDEATMMMMLMIMMSEPSSCRPFFFSEPKVTAFPSEQKLDCTRPTFKWNPLAMTVHYNHVDVLELCPAHGQPIQSLRFVVHNLTVATFCGHGAQCRQPKSRDSAHISITRPMQSFRPGLKVTKTWFRTT